MYIVNYPCVFRGESANQISFFLAGNLTDWRKTLINKLTGDEFYTTIIIDPVYNKFDVEKNTLWEFNTMNKVDCIVFWFGKETLAPITLFNLGCVCRDHLKPFIIAIDPEYPKRDDIVEQLRYFRPGIPVYETLDELVPVMASFIEACNGKTYNADQFFDTVKIGLTD